MAFQEIGNGDIWVEKEAEDEELIPSVTAASEIKAEYQNGAIENIKGELLREEEKLETNSGALVLNISTELSLNCDTKMPAELSGVPGSNSRIEEMSFNKILNKTMGDFGTIDISNGGTHPNNFNIACENSSRSASTDSLNSDSTSGEIGSIFRNDKDITFHHAEEEREREHNCLLHSLALHKIEEKQLEILQLESTVTRLKDLLSVETEKSAKIQELEQLLLTYERELNICKKEQEIDKRTFEAMKKEIDNKCAQLKKDCDSANREKENMVMRYAVSEKELIDIKKDKEIMAKKIKDLVKENESLMDKMKTLVSEKSKLSHQLDTRTTDLSTAHKEIDKLKDEINARDIKIKWTQNKLKTEMETHKECPSQIDKLMTKVRNLEEELSAAKSEGQNLKKQLQESEQNKALESQLKEEQAKLIMERHEHSEIDTKYKSLQSKHQSIIEENNTLSIKVQRLETERLEMEKKLSTSREETEKLSSLVSELQSKLLHMDSLASQLKQSESKVETLMSEMEQIRHQNEELLQDMSACRAREAEMLSFTQQLTTKNVQLQSEFSAVETKASDLQKSEDKYKTKLKDLKHQVNNLQMQLTQEKAKRDEETRLLARQVAEKTKKGELAESELLDTKAALTQTKQKHGTIVKELQRELSQLRRKLEQFETSGSFSHSESLNSLTDSNFIQNCELPTKNLVERILKLQADNAKLTEKIEFLEEHNAYLVGEVQHKTRLLQSYIAREEAGALAPSFIDNHKSVLIGWSKLKTPAEVSKHGGIMASLYGATPQDDGMSLELCLEINRKLQAVLEDTLLKNIMLKENLDTLGDEISRLTGKK